MGKNKRIHPFRALSRHHGLQHPLECTSGDDSVGGSCGKALSSHRRRQVWTSGSMLYKRCSRRRYHWNRTQAWTHSYDSYMPWAGCHLSQCWTWDDLLEQQRSRVWSMMHWQLAAASLMTHSWWYPSKAWSKRRRPWVKPVENPTLQHCQQCVWFWAKMCKH